MLSDSTAGYREIVCERKSQSMHQTSLLSYFKKSPRPPQPSAPTTLISRCPSTLRQAPPATERWQFTEASDDHQCFKKFSYCCSVNQSCPTLCNPINGSTLGFPVLHYPEFAQSQVHWVSDAIQSSVTPFSFYLQSFPASGAFQMNPFFESSGQNFGVSASASILPMNIQD